MRKSALFLAAGAVAGTIGLLGAALLLKRFRGVKVVADAEDRLVDEIMKVALPKRTRKSKKVTKKTSVAVKQKKSKTGSLLSKMKKGSAYTQVELAELANIPYRSVRRYVESLVAEKKLETLGYGKGKKFSRR